MIPDYSRNQRAGHLLLYFLMQVYITLAGFYPKTVKH